MVWQQWVLVCWLLLRLPFMIRNEVERDRVGVKPEYLTRAITIGIVALLSVAIAHFALIVSI